MIDQDWLAERFEANRSHLRGIAFRMLGSLTEADDAVQEELGATELEPAERVAFFRDTLGPIARGIPFGVAFIRVVDGVDLQDPVGAAEGRRVFELHPIG